MTEIVPVPADTPQVLLEHHLKALRLPTFPARVRQGGAAVRRRGHRLSALSAAHSELELLDRERRATERCVRQAKFTVVKSFDRGDFLAAPSLNKAMVLELVRCEFLLRREFPPKRESIDVNETIREMVVLLRGEGHRHAVSMCMDLAADLPKITADHVQRQRCGSPTRLIARVSIRGNI